MDLTVEVAKKGKTAELYRLHIPMASPIPWLNTDIVGYSDSLVAHEAMKVANTFTCSPTLGCQGVARKCLYVYI